MCSHGGEPSGFQRNSYAKISAKGTVIEHQLSRELMHAKVCRKPDWDTGADRAPVARAVLADRRPSATELPRIGYTCREIIQL